MISINVFSHFLMLTTLILSGVFVNAQSIPLNGPWDAELENGQKGKINFPGTLNDAKLGNKAQQATYGALTANYQYVGKAIYKYKLTVPENLAGRDCELFFERILWKSTLSVDGKVIGSCDSLATPHCYSVNLSKGEHLIEVEIDNSRLYKITDKGHSYGDSMQTIWNGIIGKLEFRLKSKIEYAEINNHYPAKEVSIQVEPNLNIPCTVVISHQGEKILTQSTQILNGKIQFPIEKTLLKPWNEFTPNLYKFEIYTDNKDAPAITLQTGFRTFKRTGNQFYINEQPLFLRGNLDNCHFPLTGYPSMDKAAWIRIMKISKANGLNCIRFHTWCPPQAAFDAADEIGIYLAPEAGIWIDGWMMAKGFQDVMGLGKDPLVSDFTQREMNNILKTYGNAASFMGFCIGNELGNADFKILNEWMAKCKAKDTRHLYSVSTARAITPSDDYYVSHNYPGIGGIRERYESHTNWNYEHNYSRTKVPTIAHEIGQWPVYPDWDEINKYTGLLSPLNLIGMRELSKKNGTFRFNKQFANASLKTNRLMYKDEIESLLRTPSCRGIHLLGIQDYSGQGEALIGWLDSFYDTKPGLEKSPQVQQFFAPISYLASFPKYNWVDGEQLEVQFLIRNSSNQIIKKGTLIPYQFDSQKGQITIPEDIEIGQLKKLDNIKFPICCTEETGKKIRLTFGTNQWDFWTYPKQLPNIDDLQMVCTTDYDEAITALKEGKKVIYWAHNAGTPKTTIRTAFLPVYWSTTWFPGQPRTTLGLWVQNQHPAFQFFPTDNWQDWLWYFLINNGKSFLLKDLPENFTPLAMPIDDFHRSRFNSNLFELSVDKGKLLVCGLNISGNNRPEAKQLKYSLMHYVSSDQFNPSTKVDIAWLDQVVAPVRIKLAPRPQKYKKATIYIEPGAKLQQLNRDTEWKKNLDRIEMTEGELLISGPRFRLWKENTGSFWVCEKVNITLKNITQLRGQLLIRFKDPNRANREGKGTCEGRPFTIPKHQNNPNQEYWLTLPIDLEDMLDGQIKIEIEKTSGPNLMIDRMIYMPNNE